MTAIERPPSSFADAPEPRPASGDPSRTPSQDAGGSASTVRRLTAIMFTDMAGFTALVQEDERTARLQRNRQRVVLQRAVKAHGGTILEIHGDGTLSVFPSAVEAVRAAIGIQAELRTEPAVPLRIGVHTGDIIHDQDGVFGDGVNVASRIQGLSVPGGVLISAKVFDDLKNQADIRTRSLGAFDLKNVKRPTEVFAVVGEGLASPSEIELASTRSRECRSVAVLPFVNMSPDAENEFFSDGISEEIINALTRVNGLQVTARTSSFAFKNRNEDVREIGARLGVGTVLEGSVRRAGKRVRIAAQLVDTRDGYHLFSEVYDRTIEDIFDTQDEIARTIVNRLEGHLAPGGGPPAGTANGGGAPSPAPERLVRGHGHDADAYAEYLKGRFHFARWTPEGARLAIEHFERSISLDPKCALPHTGMASAHTFLGALGQVRPADAFPRAEAAARRAIELEDVGESHLALAGVKLFYDWDFAEAYRAFQKALSLIPGSADVHNIYAMYLRAVGERDEAIEEMETALKLDPLSLPVQHTLGVVYMDAGRYEEAEARFEATLAESPDFRAAIESLGWLAVLRGDLEAAAARFEALPRGSVNVYSGVAPRGYVYGRMGREAEARAMLATLDRRRSEQPEAALQLDYALVHAGLGEREAALDDLDAAFEERLGGLVFLRANPLWDGLREEPRFQALVGRIGIPHAQAP